MTRWVMIAMLGVAPAWGAFEKGGVLDTDPRSAALGGATEASAPAAIQLGSNPAGLALLSAPAIAGLGGVSSAASLAASGIAGGGMVEGLGLGGGFTQITGDGSAERTFRAAIGIPAGELPGAAFGAALKFRQADLGTEKATGFGLDLGAVSAIPVPVDRLAVSAAASLQDVLGSLDWTGGLTEPVAREGRLGFTATWADRITAVGEARVIRGATRNEQLLGFGFEETYLFHGVALALREGWRDGSLRKAALTAGLGAGYGPVTVDYAVAGAGPAGAAIHLVSATWAFPGNSPWTSGSVSRTAAVRGEATMDENPAVFATPYAFARIMIHAPSLELVTSWSVMIVDGSGAVVWSADGDGLPPTALTWSGVGLDGKLVPSGEYRTQLMLKGPGTVQYLSPGARFKLVRPAVPAPKADDEGPGGF